MVTAVDTSVLLDVLLNDPQHAPRSISALRQATTEGSLVICETTLAEIAGEMFRTYLDRGGKRGRVVPDFLIAAHAQSHATRLLARDRGYYRDYFNAHDGGTR